MLERDFFAILSALRAHDVAFILVGGLAAALDGAPVTTYDTDVVHLRDEANVERLLRVLADLEAIFRIRPEQRLKPSASRLAGPGHLNLITRCGPLDLLGNPSVTISAIRSSFRIQLKWMSARECESGCWSWRRRSRLRSNWGVRKTAPCCRS